MTRLGGGQTEVQTQGSDCRLMVFPLRPLPGQWFSNCSLGTR